MSRAADTIGRWYVGADGSVQDNYWYQATGKWGCGPLAPPGSTSRAGRIGAVSRTSGTLELWLTGTNGSVQDSFWHS